MPPPFTGMSAVSAAMLGKLEEEKANVTVIDLAASGHSRGYLTRLKRVPRILSGLMCLAALRGAHGRSEERRVGKERRSGRKADDRENKRHGKLALEEQRNSTRRGRQ